MNLEGTGSEFCTLKHIKLFEMLGSYVLSFDYSLLNLLNRGIRPNICKQFPAKFMEAKFLLKRLSPTDSATSFYLFFVKKRLLYILIQLTLNFMDRISEFIILEMLR
jgi:hypothetical protein